MALSDGTETKVSLVNVPASGRATLLAHLMKRTSQWVSQGRKVAWLLKDEETAKRMDERLWTFDDTGFLPHSILGADSSPLDPVLLVVGTRPPTSAQVVLNFCPDPVDRSYFSGTGTDREVLDFVDTATPEGDQSGRAKWAYYKTVPGTLSHLDMSKGGR
jgi:DNA polymerase-3 subunit chi